MKRPLPSMLHTGISIKYRGRYRFDERRESLILCGIKAMKKRIPHTVYLVMSRCNYR